jgi:23S rRNA pseudouridine1911/1915/1917 synthase
LPERTITEVLPAALAGQRIDRVVALVADISRRRASELIAAGGVLLDGTPAAKPSERVAAGAVISFALVDPAGVVVDALDVPLVHVDGDVIVVDKPAGLVVHGGPGIQEITLADQLLSRFGELDGVGDRDRPGIVHRLDKGTSGLLVVARTESALASLAHQLRRRSVERRYLTLVDGEVEAEAGVIAAPLGRSPRDPTRRAVVAAGKPARTGYEVVERFPLASAAATSLVCRLETGRTHQIRAHLSAIGHPVLGDTAYGGATGVAAGVAGLARPFLHAETLGFDHPVSGERLRFTSPLPDDLVSALDRVRAAAGPRRPAAAEGG